MTLWRLELLRLTRTRRWLAVVGVYAAFGVVGPLTARYLQEIVAAAGGGIQITAPPPTPADGIAQFVGNAGQLGLLAVVVVAAAALAGEGKPELAAFLRTRVRRPADLVVPRYVATTVLAAAALIVGTATAWALTAALIGAPPAGAVVVGTGYGIAYLAFAVAVVALAAGCARSQVTAVLLGVAVLLALPVVGLIGPVRPWLPSQLLGAVSAIVAGEPASESLRALAVTAVATPALVALAVRRTARREL